MKEYTGTQDEMRCPRCASHSTQSVAIAYAESARKGSAGYESISNLGEQIAPPKVRDEKFWPGVLGCVAATIAFFKLPRFLDTLDIEALQNMSSFNWLVVGLSCVVGWAAGLLLAIPAIRYNLRVLPRLIAKWQRGMICKRCAYRWQRGPLESEDVEENSHGA